MDEKKVDLILEDLFEVIKKGDINDVKSFIDQNQKDGVDLFKANIKGKNALMVSSYVGNKDIFQYLLEKGSDYKSQMKDGTTSLYVAAQNGNLDIVKLLLDKDVDINLARNSISPLIIATKNNHEDIVEVLLKAGADANLQIDHDINDNHINNLIPKGSTALHIAAIQDNATMTNLLLNLNYKENTNIINDQNDTPFSIAIENGRGEIVKIL